MKKLAVLVLTITVAVLVPAAPAHAYAPGETTLWRSTNAARIAAKRVPLRLDAKLSAAARAHSRAMASKDRIFHSDLRRTVRAFTWRVAGENVGVGSSVASLQAAFMASRPHRANILDSRYRRMGVGFVWEGRTGYVTVLFLG